MMQREISDRVFLGETLNPYDDAGKSAAVDRTASNYNDAKKKYKKCESSLKIGRYDKISQNIYLVC